jgi:membrane-bound lytic murein transglycosylase B
VDFDGDEQRDIWTNPEDAIGSIANYFHRHDWQGLNPAAVRVSVSGSRIDAVADRSLQLKYTVGQLRDLGVDTGELASDLAATIYRVEGEQGIEYWLALHDFYVITRYNRSHLYALAVDHIARATRARREASVSS